MGLHKAPDGSIHDDMDGTALHLLPVDCVEITQAEADALQPLRLSPHYTALREAAYAAEADPLFFQEQRGEVAAGTWAAKISEIKARYPKP